MALNQHMWRVPYGQMQPVRAQMVLLLIARKITQELKSRKRLRVTVRFETRMAYGFISFWKSPNVESLFSEIKLSLVRILNDLSRRFHWLISFDVLLFVDFFQSSVKNGKAR